MLMAQFLEQDLDSAIPSPAEAARCLRQAFERLPLSHILVGWHLPLDVIHASRQECARAGAELYRWHPLLTGDSTLTPRPEWHTVGLDGERVPGFEGRDEFTFICPNRPAVREAILRHVCDLARIGTYDGFFLDRIRYPSPAADPHRLLACFCDDCCRAAAQEGLDLEAARQKLRTLLTTPGRTRAWLTLLLKPAARLASDPEVEALRAFLAFRARSVTRFVGEVAEQIHDQGLAVGLDCFTPSLAPLVGQDLGALDACCDWLKVMSYGHTMGPAGLPFEILGLVDGLVGGGRAGEGDALRALSEILRLDLPSSRDAFQKHGLPSQALENEIRRARGEGVRTLLAGIELVELEGITHLHPDQIAADLRAFRSAGADGLVLSWDLWHIPLDHLDLVQVAWTCVRPKERTS